MKAKTLELLMRIARWTNVFDNLEIAAQIKLAREILEMEGIDLKEQSDGSK